MNKTDLIDKIAAGSGLSKADSKKALDATVAAIKGALVKGDKVQVLTPQRNRKSLSPPRRLPSSRQALN